MPATIKRPRTLPLLLAAFFCMLMQMGIGDVVAQPVPLNDPLSQWHRYWQVMGQSPLRYTPSFLVRPVAVDAGLGTPPSSRFAIPFTSLTAPFPHVFGDVRVGNVYNRRTPYYLRNTEAIFPAPGNTYIASVRAGLRWGFISLQANPTYIYAENDAYMTFPSNYQDFMWRTQYREYFNLIDRPERYRNARYYRVIPGNSYITAHAGPINVSVSTQNLWWGPGQRQSLLLSNNAEGFLHASIGSGRPITTPVGGVEFQMIWGKLENSGQEPIPIRLYSNRLPMPYIEKEDDWSLFQGLILAWQPRWTPGLYFGAARTLVSYSEDIKRRDQVFSVFRSAFHELRDPAEEDIMSHDLRDKFDDKFALYVRYVAPEVNLEVYGEWARNARMGSWDDFWELPEHGAAWILGLSKLFDLPFDNTWLRVSSEFTQLEKTNTWRTRYYPTWYVHPVVRHGYTHRGQILGAGVGPGGNTQYLGIDFLRGRNRVGIFAERAIYNNDMYYMHFTTSRLRHWVDMAYGFEGELHWRNITFSGSMTFIQTLNYWYIETTEPDADDYSGFDWWNRNVELNLRYSF